VTLGTAAFLSRVDRRSTQLDAYRASVIGTIIDNRDFYTPPALDAAVNFNSLGIQSCPSLSADLREAQHACRGIAFTQRSKMAFLKFGMRAS